MRFAFIANLKKAVFLLVLFNEQVVPHPVRACAADRLSQADELSSLECS